MQMLLTLMRNGTDTSAVHEACVESSFVERQSTAQPPKSPVVT